MIKELLIPGGRIYMPELWMDYPPGAEANYSNLGYVILGYLVELISNQSIEEYCLKSIFNPLNMKDTRFHPKEVDRRRLAALYEDWRIIRPIQLPQFDLLYFSPAGGIRSSVEDLSHFLIAHMNGGVYNGVRILNESTVNLMHTIQYPNSSYTPINTSFEMKFGLGWFYTTDENNDTWGGHTGGGPGCAAFMRVRVTDNKGFIAYYNRTGFNESERKAVIFIIQAIKEKLNEM
jgi:CubicO group peptidase (beta-lactamase class C family)